MEKITMYKKMTKSIHEDSYIYRKDQKTINDFGKMIRKWRLRRNYGLRDFAILLNIDATLLTKLENPENEKKYENLKCKPLEFLNK